MDDWLRNAKKKVNDYYIMHQIGSGSVGKVFHARTETSKDEFAIKQISKTLVEENKLQVKSLQDEVSILKSLKHPNIVRFVDCLITTNNYYLITELCNQGSLKNYLAATYWSRAILEPEAKEIMVQIRDAFVLLRNKRVIHNDFKIENVFVNNGVIKIGDFGTAVYKNMRAGGTVGSPYIAAPELLYSKFAEGTMDRTDLWSIGCVFYYILYQKHPFPIENEHIMKTALLNDDFRPVLGEKVSAEMKDLIVRLLRPKSNARISWNDFFEHPVWEGVVNPYHASQMPEPTEDCPQDDQPTSDTKGKSIRGESQKLNSSPQYVPLITDPNMEFIHIIDE